MCTIYLPLITFTGEANVGGPTIFCTLLRRSLTSISITVGYTVVFTGVVATVDTAGVFAVSFVFDYALIEVAVAFLVSTSIDLA